MQICLYNPVISHNLSLYTSHILYNNELMGDLSVERILRENKFTKNIILNVRPRFCSQNSSI